MSHYSVLVIGPDVEKQLAPFQENNMGDCPKQYLEFKDTEGESLADYESKKTDCFVSPEGEPHSKYDDRFRVRGTSAMQPTEYKCPEGWSEHEVPVREIYKTFEEYMADHCGDKERDPVLGRYGYWENPNAKWDWYRVGGRWAGHFKLKAAATAPTAQPGYEVKFGQEIPADDTADIVRKGEIDLDAMRADASHDAAMEYDFVAGIFWSLPPHLPWSCFGHIENIEERRTAYRSQPRIKAWDEAAKVPLDERRKLPVDLIWKDADDFLVTREQYIESAKNSVLCTFAVIKDGKWYERGNMGWWASVSDEKDKETWTSMFWNLINSLPDDTLLTVVDCHI